MAKTRGAPWGICSSLLEDLHVAGPSDEGLLVPGNSFEGLFVPCCEMLKACFSLDTLVGVQAGLPCVSLWLVRCSGGNESQTRILVS